MEFCHTGCYEKHMAMNGFMWPSIIIGAPSSVQCLILSMASFNLLFIGDKDPNKQPRVPGRKISAIIKNLEVWGSLGLFIF